MLQQGDQGHLVDVNDEEEEDEIGDGAIVDADDDERAEDDEAELDMMSAGDE